MISTVLEQDFWNGSAARAEGRSRGDSMELNEDQFHGSVFMEVNEDEILNRLIKDEVILGKRRILFLIRGREREGIKRK